MNNGKYHAGRREASDEDVDRRPLLMSHNRSQSLQTKCTQRLSQVRDNNLNPV